ncbi:hypothetical protein Gohar_015264, partial [Gossypium harknessii]|nr:hypothetical protein [Gossypium harknessii]
MVHQRRGANFGDSERRRPFCSKLPTSSCSYHDFIVPSSSSASTM